MLQSHVDTGPNHAALEELAHDHGDAFFVLDGDRFERNFRALRDAFRAQYGPTQIGYSYKTNYTPALCRIVHDLGGYAEVVSEMEYEQARALGVPGERVIFNGPVKAAWALRDAALSGATINLDNARERDMLVAVARDNPAADIRVVIRVNFAIGDDISRFGMDVEGQDFADTHAVLAELANVTLAGLHCHFPDRDLDSFRRRAEGLLAVTRRVFPDRPPAVLNIGGGYMSTLPDSLRAQLPFPPAGFDDYARTVAGVLRPAFDDDARPELFLEPGTAVVADTQSFYTRVLAIKDIRGKRFAVVAGSGFDISPIARSRHLPVTPVLAGPRDGTARQDVVGFTCIESDVLTEGLEAPLVAGDFLRYDNVGSYSVVMRPPFILPSYPVLLRHGDWPLRLIKRRQSNKDVFRDFVD